jgi:hypothetical protein
VVLENKTGRILAMTGEFSYPLSQLNRVGPPQADLPGVRQLVIRESQIASHRHQKTMFRKRFRPVPLSIQI